MPSAIITTSILALLVGLRAVESTDGMDLRARGNDYQITAACVADVNRLYGTRFRWPDDCRKRETAENIVLLYLAYYGMRHYEETGEVPTREVLARIYHCGYAGFKRGDKRGDRYWAKVRKAFIDKERK